MTVEPATSPALAPRGQCRRAVADLQRCRGPRRRRCARGARLTTLARRRPTSAWRWPSLWWCVRCGPVRCASTCGRSQPQLDDAGPATGPADRRLAGGGAGRAHCSVSPPVLRIDQEHLLYLDRYWREEEQVCADLLAGRPVARRRRRGLSAELTGCFPARLRRTAGGRAKSRCRSGLTVLTGGPGTGKTTTVARPAGAAGRAGRAPGRPRPRIALAAPTGKAAARLQEAVPLEVAKLAQSDRRAADGPAGDDAAPTAGLAARTPRRAFGTTAATDCRTT